MPHDRKKINGGFRSSAVSLGVSLSLDHNNRIAVIIGRDELIYYEEEYLILNSYLISVPNYCKFFLSDNIADDNLIGSALDYLENLSNSNDQTINLQRAI